MTNTVQVICARSGKSHDVRGRLLPEAGEVIHRCPCGCGAAEYRDADDATAIANGP